MKQQIEQMRLEQVRLSEDAAQAHRLQSLLAFKEQIIAKTVAAQVIGSSASDLSRSIYIDKGSDQGLKADMPVITVGGIVGKVLRVYPSTSLVLMVNDQSSGVGVLLEKSRLQGVLRGTSDGDLIIERVMSDEQVAAGETVLSSGGDQIFPKGLPVGSVKEVHPGKEMFLSIRVKPSADLSRLEEVLVITDKQEQPPVADSGSRVRAADVLAQRLPSVPEKPPVVVGAVPTGSANGIGQGSGSGAKPQATATTQPMTGTGPKATASPSRVNAAGAEATNPGGTRPDSGIQRPPSIQVLNRVAQKPIHQASGESGGEAGLASGSASKAAKSAVKPGQPQAKPSSPQETPLQPVTQDTPH